jgi:hypothetical protein
VTVLFTAEAAPAGATGATGATGTIHTVDFCTEILAPLLTPVCAGCHGPSTPSNPSVTGGHPPLGLDLSSAAGLRTTAIGQVADESNVGPLAQPASQPAGTPFGVDMPIITAGEPGNSWLLYKTLLAIPAAGDAGAEASALPTASSDERARLGELILGQAMPYPSTPTAGELAASPLTVEQLETLSAWIAQGAVTPASCP